MEHFLHQLVLERCAQQPTIASEPTEDSVCVWCCFDSFAENNVDIAFPPAKYYENVERLKQPNKKQFTEKGTTSSC